jgi:hypothetical protein
VATEVAGPEVYADDRYVGYSLTQPSAQSLLFNDSVLPGLAAQFLQVGV